MIKTPLVQIVTTEMIKTKGYYVILYSLGETDPCLMPGLMVMTARKVYLPGD